MGPAGSVTNTGKNAGATTCTECAAGTYADSTGGTCSACSGVNQYVHAPKQSQCHEVSHGYKKVSNTAVTCAPGFRLVRGVTYYRSKGYHLRSSGVRYKADGSVRRSCKACAPGDYCPGGTADPITCPAGSVTNTGANPGASACTLCPAGTYSNTGRHDLK